MTGALLAFLAQIPFAWGAGAAKKPSGERPELLVLVSAGQNGVDQVAVTYEGEISQARARAQLQALLRTTGWRATGVEIDTQRLAPGTPKMTSVSFTAPAVVPYPEGTLPVAPFVEAYKEHGNMVLVFQFGRPFRLAGPASYQDRYVSIGLKPGQGIYRYDVRVTDPGFAALRLPDLPTAGEAAEAGKSGRKAPPLGLVIALSLGIALSVSVAVYLLLAGRSPGRSSRLSR